jgi:hypothetical protein
MVNDEFLQLIQNQLVTKIILQHSSFIIHHLIFTKHIDFYMRFGNRKSTEFLLFLNTKNTAFYKEFQFIFVFHT